MFINENVKFAKAAPKQTIQELIEGKIKEAKKGDDCPNCGEPMDGNDLDGDPCPDCKKSISCHQCGWPDNDKDEAKKESKLSEYDGENSDRGDGYYNPNFRDPGGRSALTKGRQLFPCPTCKKPDMLTARDKAKGYQCNACADRDEGRGFGMEG